MNGFGGSQVLAATRVPPSLRSFLTKTGGLWLGLAAPIDFAEGSIP
jgi:hypothetical protein